MKVKLAALPILAVVGSFALGIVASTLAADRGGRSGDGSEGKAATADVATSKPDEGERGGRGRGARGGEGRGGEGRGGGGRGRGDAEDGPAQAAASEPSQIEPAGRGGRGRGRGRGRRGGAATEPASGDRVDARENNQQRRIAEGIRHGQLTPDEVATLESQEKNIQKMEDSFKADGTLTRDEAEHLNKALNDASLQIWAQRHDTEGNQMSVVRLGNDVISKGDLTAKIESGAMTHAQARQFLEDFRTMTSLKRRLSSDTLTDEQRATLTAQYNALLNTYFQMK